MPNGRRPSPLQLAAESMALFSEGAPQCAAALVAAYVPAAALGALAFLWTGVTSHAALAEAVREGRLTASFPLLLAGLAQRLLGLLAFLAVVTGLDARHAGRPLSTWEAIASGAERLPAFVLTSALLLLRVAGGLLLLVVPGVVLALRYSLAHLSVLLEGLQGGEALARSAELVRADPKRALLPMAAASALAALAGYAVSLLIVFSVDLAAALGAGGVGAAQGQLEALLVRLAQGLAASWLAAFSVVLYRDLGGQ